MLNAINKERVFEFVIVVLGSIFLITTVFAIAFSKPDSASTKSVMVQETNQNIVIINKSNKKIIIVDDYQELKKTDE